MDNVKRLQVFAGLVIGVIIGASVLVAKMVNTKETGDFGIGLVLAMTGTMIVSALLSYLLSIRKKKRSGNIPEIDERTIFIMKNYFMWAFYFIMVGTGLVTFILYVIDVRTVELEMIFVYQVALFMIVAMGAVVAKKIG